MGRKAVGPVCCVTHVKEPSALIVKRRSPPRCSWFVWLHIAPQHLVNHYMVVRETQWPIGSVTGTVAGITSAVRHSGQLGPWLESWLESPQTWDTAANWVCGWKCRWNHGWSLCQLGVTSTEPNAMWFNEGSLFISCTALTTQWQRPGIWDYTKTVA